MRVLVDGVFFQLASTGTCKVWSSLLNRLASFDGISLFMLDRGGSPTISGVQLIDFPTYTMTYTAADSLLIQNFCDKLDIDVFTSTYYTSATTTPQVQIVYDLIPEVLGCDLSARAWKEKRLVLSYASHFACISKNTRDDLLRFYPSIDPSRAAVTYCGIDTETFNATASRDYPAFREKYKQKRPYFLLVGFREQHGNYKNAQLVFDAIKKDKAADFDVICAGGERTINESWLRNLPSGLGIKRLDLSDTELAAAYSGALALVYPSLYEGFGLPVVEAMASGCPVITTHHGSLGEVAGEAAVVISGHDSYELLQALERIRRPCVRRGLIDAGLAQAAKFKWENSAQQFFELLLLVKSEYYNDGVKEFHRRWEKLRITQANVDIGRD
jgi:glycosyltransferase involved in cell wall biosynthesis